jgi:Methyltransferase domain
MGIPRGIRITRMHRASAAERAALVVHECVMVARTEGSSAARGILWRAVARDPSLLGCRPVLGAARRLYGPREPERGWSPPDEQSVPIQATRWIERLLADAPKLHWLSEASAQWLNQHSYAVQAGPMSWAVPPQIIRYIAANVTTEHLTIETGAGHTTVAFAALAKHHICVTIDEYCVHATQRYMEAVGIPRDKVTFIIESSDTALPRLAVQDKLDFAYIDGQHGYPFAALDWHYIDRHLKVGGIVGFDNAEIPSVHNHCEFLELNKTYRLAANISGPSLGTYAAYFYEKLTDQTREAGGQLYNHRRVVGTFPQAKADWPWG